MLAKYKTVKYDIFEYIRNRLKAGIIPPAVVPEVISRFPADIAFFDCDPSMVVEFVEWLVEGIYFALYGSYYGEAVPPQGDIPPEV